MKKSLYLSLAAATLMGFAACDEGDYTDWTTPIANGEEAPATEVTISSTDVSSQTNYVDIANCKDSAQVVSVTLNAGYTGKYSLVFSNGDIVELGPTGNACVDDLQKVVVALYGKAPKVREMKAELIAIVDVNGAAEKKTIKDVCVYAKPWAPSLEEHYYYLGELATNQTYEFKNESGENFYDDPVVSVIIPAAGKNDNGEDKWHWFRLAGSSSYDADGKVVWANEGATSICPLSGNCTDRKGSCTNGNKSWRIVEASGENKYKITVNLMEMTYSIEVISDLLEYYVVGRQNSWKLPDKTAAMYPVSTTSASYTSYFTGAWDCRIATPQQVADGNYNNFGAQEEAGTCTKLVANTNKCIMSPEAGYYTLTVDFATNTYSWTSATVSSTFEKIGLIGVNGDWNNDIEMTQVGGSDDLGTNTTHNWYAKDVEIASDCEIKFRADGAWTTNWGPTEENVKTIKGCIFGTGSQGGPNIKITAGKYNVYLNDITGQFFFIAQ